MEKKTSIFHSFTDEKNASLVSPLLIGVIVVFAILGIGTGYLLATNTASSSHSLGTSSQSSSNASSVQAGATFGTDDTTAFKDVAEGNVQSGGIDGEGQYHLVRPGGDSQNVYMTSSVVDLGQFVGHKVKVWGQTQSAQHAGWLMDVGKVEVEQ